MWRMPLWTDREGGRFGTCNGGGGRPNGQAAAGADTPLPPSPTRVLEQRALSGPTPNCHPYFALYAVVAEAVAVASAVEVAAETAQAAVAKMAAAAIARAAAAATRSSCRPPRLCPTGRRRERGAGRTGGERGPTRGAVARLPAAVAADARG